MSELYFGNVTYASGDWARIAPSAVLREGGQWTQIKSREEFPEEGQVFVPPSVGVGNTRAGASYVFRREANVRASAGKDRFVVSEAALATPILDFTCYSLEQARMRLFEQGVELSKNFGERVIVALSSGLFCFIDLEVKQSELRRAKAGIHPIPLMKMPPAWLSCGLVNNCAVLPSLTVPQLPTLRRVSWPADAEFVERMLHRARRHLSQFGSPDGLPAKETLQRVARALESQGLLPNGDDDVEADLERVRTLWPRLASRFQASEEMLSLVLESRQAKQLIDEAVKQVERSEAERLAPIVENQIREQMSSEIAAEQQKLRDTSGKLDIARIELSIAEGKVRELQEKEGDARRGVEDANRQIQEVVHSFQTLVAAAAPQDIPFVRSFLKQFGGTLGGAPVTRLPDASPPWSAPVSRPSDTEVNVEVLEAALTKRAKHFGVRSLLEIDLFLRAGELVLLTGAAADRALSAYVDTVAGGKLWTMVLDPSVIGLDDLWATSAARIPTAFSLAWSHAEANTGEIVVLCLRGIDASPLHLWLPPLAAVLRSRARPQNLLVAAVPLVLQAKSPRDDYPDLPMLDWLVPIRVMDAQGGGLSAIRMLSESSSGVSTSRLTVTQVEEGRLSADALALLSKLDASSGLRVAKLARTEARTTGGVNLASQWADALTSASQENTGSWLATDELKCLRFQE